MTKDNPNIPKPPPPPKPQGGKSGGPSGSISQPK
jgi:hypothetical protein